MNLMEFKEKLFQKAEEEGFSDYEIYYTKNDNLSINVYMGDIDKYSVSNTMGVSFRGILNGKCGAAYTTKLDDYAVDILIQGVKDSALAIDNEDKEYMISSKELYPKVITFNNELKKVPLQKKIQLALDIERETRAQSEKIVNISYCGVGFYEEEIGLINSNGIFLNSFNNFAFAAVTPVVTDGKNNYNSMSYIATRNFEDMNAGKLAIKAVKKSESYIGGESLKSGDYVAIFKNNVAAELLDTFSGVFSAKSVQKGISLLKGKKDSKIASDKVYLVDNPLLEDGLVSTAFDGEGVSTFKKNIIEGGILKSFFYNLKTAAKDGVKSTGNASRPSYSSSIGIAPSNFYFEKGEISLENMIKNMSEGVLITDIAGTHAGANMATGDFSLAAKGFYIKEGVIVRPIEQVTISGNFYEILKKIEDVGNDLEFTLPSGSSCFGSSSLLIDKISIGGR